MRICALCFLHSFSDMFVPNICIILRLVFVPNMYYHIAIRTTQEGETKMKEIEQTITTLEICEMLEMKHWQILRKLDGTKKVNGIIKILGDNKIVVSDYFIPSTYMTEQRREMPCYKLSEWSKNKNSTQFCV